MNIKRKIYLLNGEIIDITEQQTQHDYDNVLMIVATTNEVKDNRRLAYTMDNEGNIYKAYFCADDVRSVRHDDYALWADCDTLEPTGLNVVKLYKTIHKG